MEVVKFDRIVSVNNEAQDHLAENLLNGEISSSKSWQCEKGTEKGIVIVQLEKASVITKIDVGNAHSAFIEILVGRATDEDKEYQSLVPMSTFMSPNDSKLSKNPNTVRFFTAKEFTSKIYEKTWDRIKIVCSQPFNKQVKFGLCFIKVYGEQTTKKDDNLGFLKPVSETKDVQIGSFFAKRKEKEKISLNVAEQMREAENPSKLEKHKPLDPSKIAEKLAKKQSTSGSSHEKEKRKRKTTNEEDIIQKDNRRNKDLGLDEDKSPKKKKKNHKEKKDEKFTPKKDKKKTKKRKKYFKKLLEDVAFVLSGFQNPLRQNIRKHGTAMGARYLPDWVDGKATHLICVIENTPKYNQAKGKGKIVTADWIEKCYEDKKRYPWRRFALSKADRNKAESEEEIDGTDTDDNIEQGESSRTKDKSSKRDPSHDKATDEEDNCHKKQKATEKKLSDSECYDAQTESEDEGGRVDTTSYPMPYLPDYFTNINFYIDNNVKDREILERYIIAYNGCVKSALDSEVEYYITEAHSSVLDIFHNKFPNLQFVLTKWIYQINEKQTLLPSSEFLAN